MNGYEEINMDRNLRHLVSPNAIIRSKIAVHTYALSSLAQMTPTQKNYLLSIFYFRNFKNRIGNRNQFYSIIHLFQ